jgi:hypothetical protein
MCGSYYWTNAEIATLKKGYPCSGKTLLNMLPNRNWNAILQKAWSLGLTHHIRSVGQFLKTCVYCGSLFNSSGKPLQKYCSVKCRNSDPQHQAKAMRGRSHEQQSQAGYRARALDGLEKRRENGRRLAEWTRKNATPEIKRQHRAKHEQAVKTYAEQLEKEGHQIIFVDVKPCMRPDIIAYKGGKIYFFDAKARKVWHGLITEKTIPLIVLEKYVVEK